MRRIMIILLLALLVGVHAHAQTRSLVWETWDVQIDRVDALANQFFVTERYQVQFSGVFRFGTFVLPNERLGSIDQMQVSIGGVELTNVCSSGQSPGTFCLLRTGSEYTMTYFFPRPVENEQVEIAIEYRVSGAIRYYQGGDQLWWDAIPEEHFGFPIRSATVTIVLPNHLAPRANIDPIETYGATGSIEVSGARIIATAPNGVGGEQGFSVRVQFPHTPYAQVATWQAGFDAERAFEENIQPLITLLVLIGSVLIGGGIPLAMFSRWRTVGRDPAVGPVPEYLAEPPSSLQPGLIGVLVDENAQVRDVLATLIDLARRGYLVIEEDKTDSSFGIIQNSEFTFKRTDKTIDDLRQFERALIDGVFGRDRLERSLNDLRNKFYTVLPVIQGAMYRALVEDKLFAVNPQTRRSRWSSLGAGIVILAVIGFFVSAPLSELSPLLFLLPLALMIAGFSVIAFGMAMTSKTPAGALEVARWKAFRQYLRNLEQYSDVESVSSQFEAFLPYSVAFGIDSLWIQRFRRIESMPAPTWYYPVYRGGAYRRYTPGTPLPRMGEGVPGEIARADLGGSGLESMSGDMSRGLESLSTGLTTMLNSASSAFTSVPQSSSSGSWSSGGRSFSGGGFRSSGGSGGGSRGFG